MEYIYEIENSLSEDVCNIIIEKFEQDPRKFPGATIGGVDRNIKRSIDLRITTLPEWKDIDTILYNALHEGLKQYYNYLLKYFKDIEKPIHVLDFFENIKDNGYQIQRSSNDDFYIWHHDGNLKEKRLITFIWYLNTINTIENGGFTDFHCGKSIKPVQGKLVFFPATWTYPHCGRTVKNTTKYICTGFICDRSNINENILSEF